MKLIIPGIPPSQNKTERMHHMKRHRLKMQWEELVGWEAIRQKVVPQVPIQKANVILRYFFRQDRGQDPDNYNGKFLMDGIRKIGIIQNDTFKNVHLHAEWGGIDRNNPRVEICIEQVQT